MPPEMKSNCEGCKMKIGPQADAYICSFECTFYSNCNEKFGERCPNCKGELVRRPKRPKIES